MAVMRGFFRVSAFVVPMLMALGILAILAQFGAGAQRTSATPDQDTVGRVQRLRSELCLGNMDLASLGCDGQAARGVLQRLVDWTQQNSVAMASADEAERHSRMGLQDSLRSVHLGTAGATARFQIQQSLRDVATAQADRQRLVSQVKSTVSGYLPAGAYGRWDNAVSHGGPVPAIAGGSADTMGQVVAAEAEVLGPPSQPEMLLATPPVR